MSASVPPLSVRVEGGGEGVEGEVGRGANRRQGRAT